MYLDVEILNDTAFCCSVNNATTPFVWPGYIEVYDTGVHWFTDAVGITATPQPPRGTLVPPPPEQTNAAGEVINGPTAGSSSSSSAGGSSSDGTTTTVSPDGGNTALILGACLVAVAAVVAILVLLYLKWWRPRHNATEKCEEGERHRRVDDVILPEPMHPINSERSESSDKRHHHHHHRSKIGGGGGARSDGLFDEIGEFSSDL
jgi:hypothetical protein